MGVCHVVNDRLMLGHLSCSKLWLTIILKQFQKEINFMNSSTSVIAKVKEIVLLHLPSRVLMVLLRRFVVQSDYRAKRESAKFFELSNIAYGARQMNKSNRLLSTSLRLLGPTLPILYFDLLRSCVRTTAKEPSRRNICSDSVLEATNAIVVNTLDATGWYQLSRGLFSLGYFRAACIARENSLDLSISEGSKQRVFNTSSGRAIEALLERRSFRVAQELLDRFSSEIEVEPRIEFVEYLGMMQDNYVSSRGQNPVSELESTFHKLISGRTVAIVGPGAPTMELGKEIDSSDCVIRIKYPGLANLPDESFYGSRCDVNYYGNSEILSLSRSSGKQIGENILLTPKINLSYSYLEPNSRELRVVNLRFGGPLYRANATAGMRVLFGILAESPGDVRIYGFDFYAGATTYSDEHISFHKKSARLLGHNKSESLNMKDERAFYRCVSFLRHDPVSNFCFAQNLYKAGLFEIEPYGKSILELTPYQYVERLEKMLGDW